MKYIVGYQMTDREEFLEELLRQREHIHEVYYSWGDFPNGRNSLDEDGLLFEKQLRMTEDLEKLAQAGFHFNLLFNGNCYGNDSQSRAFFNKIGETLQYLQNRFGVASVTTSSPLIARFIRENFTGIEIRASVNMEIGTVRGMAYSASYFDSYYMKREFNRDFQRIAELKEWCDLNGKGLFMLANSGCLADCSAHNFHDNLVAHQAGISKMDNGYQFTGICRDYLRQAHNRVSFIRDTTFIRPEDMNLYEQYFPAVKLATRVNSDPAAVLRAYVRGTYSGSILKLLEPDHSALLFPYALDNKSFSSDFAARTGKCGHNCNACGYCREVYENALVNMEDLYADK